MANVRETFMQYMCQVVYISDAVKRRPCKLFATIGGQILRCFFKARLTLLVLLILALATLLKILTSFWSWGRFDGYTIVFGFVSFFVGFPLVQVFEEFFHAAVPIAKGRPEWLKSMLVANLYAPDKKTILVFMFVAIQHQGELSPLDGLHISAAGPLGVLAVAGIGLAALVVYKLSCDANILYPALVILPFMFNGLLSLIPARNWFRSDGSNMVAMARQLELTRCQFLQESLRGMGFIARYLKRYALRRAA